MNMEHLQQSVTQQMLSKWMWVIEAVSEPVCAAYQGLIGWVGVSCHSKHKAQTYGCTEAGTDWNSLLQFLFSANEKLKALYWAAYIQ